MELTNRRVSRLRNPAHSTGQSDNPPRQSLPKEGTRSWRELIAPGYIHGDECLRSRLPPPYNILIDKENRFCEGALTRLGGAVTPRILQLMQHQAVFMQDRNFVIDEVLTSRKKVRAAKLRLEKAVTANPSSDSVPRLKTRLVKAEKVLADNVKKLTKSQRMVTHKHQELESAFNPPWLDQASYKRGLRYLTYVLAVLAIGTSAVAITENLRTTIGDYEHNLDAYAQLRAQDHDRGSPRTDAQLRESELDTQLILIATVAAMVTASICAIIESRFGDR